jgi:hypothetical protein
MCTYRQLLLVKTNNLAYQKLQKPGDTQRLVAQLRCHILHYMNQTGKNSKPYHFHLCNVPLSSLFFLMWNGDNIK